MEYPNLSGDEFKRFINFFRLIFIGVTTAITFLVTIGLYFSYKDMNSMRQEVSERSKEIASQLKEMRQQSQQEISSTQDYALKQIAMVREDARTTAMTSTKLYLEDIFSRGQVKTVIEDVAEQRIRRKLDEIVNSNINQFEGNLQERFKTTVRLNAAYDRIRWGERSEYDFVDSLRRFSRDTLVRNVALMIIESKTFDYDVAFKNDDTLFTKNKYTGLRQIFSEPTDTIFFHQKPSDSEIGEFLFERIEKGKDLSEIYYCFLALPFFTDYKIRPFDFETFREAQRNRKARKRTKINQKITIKNE